MSITAFLYGIPTGFVFSFALGPVFFTLIKSSLNHGFRFAIYIASGVILADIVLLLFAYSGLEVLVPKTVNIAFWIQLTGSFFLFVLGISNFLKKTVSTEGVPIQRNHLIARNLLTGFLLNILNPANFIEWMGAVGVLKHRFHYNTYQNISFFTGALLAVFLTELGISFFASKLRRILNEKVMLRINITTGVVFCAFGAWMLFDAFF
jgi:threonine/homoserine/homoserine lactone efflux protein